jgi:5-methylcytosine-specific restriction endonuclease McrA
MIVMTRKKALSIGATTYFTGRPCKNGHKAYRSAASGSCLVCRKLQWKSYRTRHKEKRGEQSKAWFAAHPNYYRERYNSEKQRQYYLANKAQCAKRTRRQREKNQAKYTLYKRHRDALKRGSRETHSVDDIDKIRKLQHGKCAYCHKTLNGREQIDHIVAIANGGSNGRKNLQILCPECNVRKSNRDPLVFSRMLGLLI